MTDKHVLGSDVDFDVEVGQRVVRANVAGRGRSLTAEKQL